MPTHVMFDYRARVADAELADRLFRTAPATCAFAMPHGRHTARAVRSAVGVATAIRTPRSSSSPRPASGGASCRGSVSFCSAA